MKTENLEKFYRIHSKFYDLSRRFFLLDRKKAVELLNLKQGEKVIDFGCGTGLNIPHLLKQKVRIEGIDFSSSMLSKAKKKFPQINFIQGDISQYKFSKKADAIISSYSISMVEEWEKALLRMKRSLKKTGRLVILDFYPFQGNLKIFYPVFRRWLNIHGVNADKKILPFLEKHFQEVQYKIYHSGYNFIALAKFQK